MATFRNRGPFQWQAEVRKTGYPSQTKTFETKADAMAWARHIEASMDIRKFVDSGEADRTTFKQALERYLNEVTKNKKGIQEETLLVRRLQRHALGPRPMSTIFSSDIADYRESRLKSVSGTTVRKELALISHLFTVSLQDFGMTSLVNPVTATRKPKANRGRDRRFYKDEFDAVLTASESLGAQGRELRQLVGLAVCTAGRRGELLKLRWADVDVKAQTALFKDTKNGDDRLAPLSRRAVEILLSLPRQIHGRVFTLTAWRVGRLWRRALVLARTTYEEQCSKDGVQPDPRYFFDLHFHDLRHEATSRLFESGFETMDVSAITGHKTLAMLKRYTHLNVQRLAQKMG